MCVFKAAPRCVDSPIVQSRLTAYSLLLTSENMAPWGSWPLMIQLPPGTCMGPFSTFPPPALTRSTSSPLLRCPLAYSNSRHYWRLNGEDSEFWESTYLLYQPPNPSRGVLWFSDLPHDNAGPAVEIR